MKLSAIRIPCLDLGEAEAYYADLIGWSKMFGSVEAGHIGFGLDQVVVILEPEEAGEFEAGRYLGFSVEVPDIHQYYAAALARGVQFTGEPEKQPWGGIMTHITDCSGNSFSVIEGKDA